MPSSHTAFVSSLFLSIYRIEGISSSFLIALVFGLVTLRDAMGIRKAAGTHAQVLNKLIQHIPFSENIEPKELRELLGHTLIEVIAGFIVAVIGVSIIFRFF